MKAFENNVSFKSFLTSVEDTGTLIAWLKSGAILLLGKVGVVEN